MGYKAKVNNSISIDINEQDVSNLDAVKMAPSKYHVLFNNKSYSAEIINANFNSKSYTVLINNTPYIVSIEDDLDALINNMGFTIGSKKQISVITAPMPGLILDIPVEAGQTVNEDDTLLILEAMKMENSISSPIKGIIKAIKVNKGDSVEKNQLLIEFE